MTPPRQHLTQFAYIWLGFLALYEHTKSEVSSFSYSGDTRDITDRITDRQSESQPD